MDVLRRAQSDSKQQVRFLHISRFQWKEPIEVRISKILLRGLNVFCLQQTFMIMNCKFL